MLSSNSLSLLRLDGGIFCLDFVNTIDHRKRENSLDYLDSFKALITWYGHTKILPVKLLHTLERLGKDYPNKATIVYEKSLQLRELLHSVFLLILHKKNPSVNDQLLLNGFITESFANLEINWASGQGNLQFNSPALEQLYWWPVKSATDLLISPRIKQLKECPACGWLFLDQSKNQSRKWCSMSTCGDVNKVTRNYQRNKRKKND